MNMMYRNEKNEIFMMCGSWLDLIKLYDHFGMLGNNLLDFLF